MLTINLHTEHSSDGWNRETTHFATVTVYVDGRPPTRETYFSNRSKLGALEEALKGFGLDIHISKSPDKYVSY